MALIIPPIKKRILFTIFPQNLPSPRGDGVHLSNLAIDKDFAVFNIFRVMIPPDR